LIHWAGRQLLGVTGLRWLLLLWLSARGCAAAQPRQAVVLSIGDGDTIRVRQGGRAMTVRLACIVATEVAQNPSRPAGPGGSADAATNRLGSDRKALQVGVDARSAHTGMVMKA